MTQPRTRGRPPHPDTLTPAEWRVAEGVRHGLTNPQIAARQGISGDAVKFHVSNILGKLGLASRAELRRWTGVAADSAMHSRAKAGGQAMTNSTVSVGEGAIGPIGQVARTVSDIAAATAWYRDTLGLPHLFSAGTMAFFDCGGTRLMLSEGQDGQGAGPESILYFTVGDLHAEAARLEAAGAKLVSAPHRIHTHDDGTEEWMAFVEDNDGRPLGLMAKVAPA